MKKIVCRMAAVILVLVAIAGVFQWHNYDRKTEYRQEALLYFKEEDYEKSILYLDRALALHSVFAGKLNRDMSCYLAESHYQLKEYEEAERIYDGLIKQDESCSEYYMLKGKCVANSGNFDKAVRVYKEGWKQTENTDFLEKICEMYVEKEDYENALSYVEKGIRQGGSTKARFLFREIVIYEKSGDYERAYEAAERYVKLYPDDKEGQKEFTFLSTRI